MTAVNAKQQLGPGPGLGLVSLQEDLAHYHETYKVCLGNSTDGKIVEWLEENFEKEVVKKLASSFSTEQELHILGIGTGEGNPDMIMLEKFLTRFEHIHATIVEPAKSASNKFRVKVERRDDLRRMTFDWLTTTIDNYRETVRNDTKFAFISLIQSLYYTHKELSDAMDYLLSILSSGGILLIQINSDHNQAEGFLADKFWMEESPILTGEILEIVKLKGVGATCFPISSDINVTSVFDDSSEEGMKLLDFLTETCNFRQTAPPDVLADTLASLKSRTVMDGEGNYLLCNDSDFLIIFKDK